jgi:hypothetical protein
VTGFKPQGLNQLTVHPLDLAAILDVVTWAQFEW